MFYILLQNNGRGLKPKNRLVEQLNAVYLTIKQRWYWVLGLAILFAGVDYLRKDVKEPMFSTRLSFLVNYEDITVMSDLKRKKNQKVRDRWQNLSRQREVLDLMNEVLTSQEFQAKVLFTKATIEGQSDFLANHIIHYQKLPRRQSKQQQQQGLAKSDLVGFKFTHGDVTRFTLREQRVFSRLSRQLPSRLGSVGKKGNNSDQFVEEETGNKLMESVAVNGAQRELPIHFSFRARSRNRALPATILTTVYDQFNKHFEAYHHHLFYTIKEAIKIEVARQEEKEWTIAKKKLKIKATKGLISPSYIALPIKQLDRELKELVTKRIVKNPGNLLLQLEILATPRSPFLLTQSPEINISLPATGLRALYRAMFIFSIVTIIGFFFLLIKDYVIDKMTEIRIIWREN